MLLVFNLPCQAEGLVTMLFGTWVFPWLLETKFRGVGVLLKKCQDMKGVLASFLLLSSRSWLPCPAKMQCLLQSF